MIGKKILDKESSYKIDKDNVYGSVLALPEQILSIWKQTEDLKISDELKEIDKIVVAGMGGSALGARVIKSLAGKELKVPLEIVNDYHLPGYADENTLVILSSYSGNTEEVLATAKESVTAGCKNYVITTGGELFKMAQDNDWPIIEIDPVENPSDQPRMAIGYSVMAQMSLFNKMGVWNLEPEMIERVINWLSHQQESWVKEIEQSKNSAKRLSFQLKDRAAVLIAGDFLQGAVHVFKNQLNENAKSFAVRFDIPELNHHLMEGLGKPEDLDKKLHFLLFDSKLYEDKIRKRIKVTEEVILKQGYEVTRLVVEGKSKFDQAWEVIQFGEFVSLYLAVLHKINPAPIPWVDFFKKQIKNG